MQINNEAIKILVIEDELEIRANLLELLEMEGYSAIGADNGVTGLLGALEHSPDIILCDVMMPELNGLEVLAALRQEPETALTPFVFLTALADKGDVRQGMTLGADDYITKPFTCQEVVDAIETRLQRQNVLAGQQKMEQETVAALQQEIQDFRANLDGYQAALIADIRLQLKTGLKQLSIASSLLKTLTPGEERERSIALIESVCIAQVKMLSKVPNLDYLSKTIQIEQQDAQPPVEELLPEAAEATMAFHLM